MKLIVAFNAFKGSMSPIQAGEYFIKGWRSVRGGDEIVHFPIADGGDGTTDVWRYHFGGHVVYVDAHDALMRKKKVPVIIGRQMAMFSIADVAGIADLSHNERNPHITTTYGVGEVIAYLIKKGIKDIYISVGGSATVDGGIGLLLPLGFTVIGKGGVLEEARGDMILYAYDVSVPSSLPKLNITVLSDVKNPLCGETGAAYVYGPQKGLKDEDIYLFDSALKRWADIVEEKTGVSIQDKPGYGAAGGIAVALHLIGDVKIVSGIDYILEKAGFKEKAKGASLLITGEGKIDRQTFMGKAPYGVAMSFRDVAKDGKVVAIGGKVEWEEIKWHVFDAAFSLVPGPISLSLSIKNAPIFMEYMGRNMASLL